MPEIPHCAAIGPQPNEEAGAFIADQRTLVLSRTATAVSRLALVRSIEQSTDQSAPPTFHLSDLQRLLQDTRNSAILRQRVDYLPLEDREYASALLIGYDQPAIVLERRDLFPVINTTAVAERLIEDGRGALVIEHLDQFANLDQLILFEDLLKAWHSTDLIRNLDKFSTIDQKTALRLFIKHRAATEVMHYNQVFTEMTPLEIIRMAVAMGQSEAVCKNIDCFMDLCLADLRTVAMLVIDAGYGVHVIENYRWFQRININALIPALVDADCADRLIGNADSLPELDHAVLLHTIVTTYPDELICYTPESARQVVAVAPDRFGDITTHTSTMIHTNFASSADQLFATYQSMLTAAKVALPPVIRTQREVFGRFGNQATARALDILMNEAEPTAQLREFGVTTTGESGIAQLRAAFESLLLSVVAADDTAILERIQSSELARRLFASITEYSTTKEYGQTSQRSLMQKITTHQHWINKGAISPRRPEYTLSKLYEMPTAKSVNEQSGIYIDARHQYHSFQGELSTALMYDQLLSHGFDLPDVDIFSNLRLDATGSISQIERDLEGIDPADNRSSMKRQNLIQRRQKLLDFIDAANDPQPGKRFIMHDKATFQHHFATLEPYAQLHSEIRSICMGWTLHTRPEAQHLKSGVLAQDPTINDMRVVCDFVDNTVVGGAFVDHFTDKVVAGRFRRLMSVNALKQAINHTADRTTRSSGQTLQFAPSRGILLEISGQIADACWADQYNSIANTMPGVTAVIMWSKPGTTEVRAVGAALLMETTDSTTGDKVLLLRGTNPTENYINKVDVATFYDAITDYVRGQADKLGCIPAIVIDGEAGGAGTNRPVLNDYLLQRRKTMQKITVDPIDSEFNHYSIDQLSYRL